MKWNSQKFALAFVVSLVSIQSFSANPPRTLYGLDDAQHFQSQSHGEFYIQLGAFQKKSNADQFLKTMQLNTNYPIAERQTEGRYVVAMGPLHSAAEVRAASQNFIPVSAGIVTASREKMYAPMALSHKRYALHALGRNNDMYSPFDRSFIPTEAGWYIAGSLGAQSSRVDSNLGVNNGSGYPAPFGTDSYSTSTKSAAIAGMEGGYRWVRNNQWLPAYTLGLRYKHLFSTNVGRQITQYSTPEFTNYNYNWNVSSDVLLIASKLNLVQFGQFLPYVTGGVGIAFNHAANYNETALAGVTPRTNPAFDNNTDREFTYMVGAGVDWQVSPRVILSLGYEFQDLGSLSSGKGTGLWAADALHTGSYRTNSVLFSTSYLIGK